MTTRAQYTDKKNAELEVFLDNAHQTATQGSDAVLDTAAIRSATPELLSRASLPADVQETLELMPNDQQTRVLDSVLMGAESYRQSHGVLPTGDVIRAALQQGRSAAANLDSKGRVLDSVGSTDHHDQFSAQPNRIVVAITAAIAEAIPYATYLPTDIGSNEARLGIVSHQTGSAFGAYALNDLLDGVYVGETYVSSERRISLALDGTREAATGKVTGQIGGTEDTPLLRGRSIVLVNGFPVAYESHNAPASAPTSPVSGGVKLGATHHVISGTVNPDTGDVALAFSPALPAGTSVEVEGFIDFEKAPGLAPSIITQVQTYSLFAAPWRVLADQSVDSRTQYQNELGLDLQSENLMAIRNQAGMERHYASMRKLMALAKSNAKVYNFDWDGQKQEKTRAQIWQDSMSVIGQADQQMCEDTMDHGITHLYVGKRIGAQLQSLPPDLFQSSGLTVRPGVFRLGRAFGRYEVYYSPKVIEEQVGAAQILAIGRSNQVARCPIVLGDAVPPTFLPLATGTDMKSRQAFYARNFTSINPHQPSAMGAALINVTNLGL